MNLLVVNLKLESTTVSIFNMRYERHEGVITNVTYSEVLAHLPMKLIPHSGRNPNTI